MNYPAIRRLAWVLIGLNVVGTSGCLRMLPNAGVRSVSISRSEDSQERLLLQTGDDQIIRAIVNALESKRPSDEAIVPEYIIRLDNLDGTTTCIGVLGSSLMIDGKTFTSSTRLSTELQAIVDRATSQPPDEADGVSIPGRRNRPPHSWQLSEFKVQLAYQPEHQVSGRCNALKRKLAVHRPAKN